jgi:hypothetical protein
MGGGYSFGNANTFIVKYLLRNGNDSTTIVR